MDSQKILIVNLSKGKIGEDNASLLGAMIVTKVYLSAMSRVDMAEADRKDFYLYVDEFQNFATESFANILSEARKYRLSLILANQYIEQLIEGVRNAILGNCGTLICFRTGANDGEILEKELVPFTTEDFTNLPKYKVYLRLLIDGIAGDAFSADTLPPCESWEGHKEKIIKTSRERYAKSRKEIEDKINRWANI
jgi:type IV secretory pathway VirB4 component